MLLAKSLTGEEVARQLIATLSTELAVPMHLLHAAMQDQASVNNMAMLTLSIVYPQVFDIGCFSHILDRVGENMITLVLDEFTKSWISMFSRSPKAKLTWKTLTGLSLWSYSATR